MDVNEWGLPPSPPPQPSIVDTMREIQAAVEQAGPRLTSVRGRRVAVWDLLFDMGAQRAEDGSPAVLPHMGAAVVYAEAMPRNVVAFRYSDGSTRTLLQSRDARWHEVPSSLFTFDLEHPLTVLVEEGCTDVV